MNRKRSHPENPVILFKINRPNPKILNHGWTPMNPENLPVEIFSETNRNIRFNQCISVVKQCRAKNNRRQALRVWYTKRGASLNWFLQPRKARTARTHTGYFLGFSVELTLERIPYTFPTA
jgi:hypothetical protein